MAGIGPSAGVGRGVGGFSSLYKDNRKKVVASAANYRWELEQLPVMLGQLFMPGMSKYFL